MLRGRRPALPSRFSSGFFRTQSRSRAHALKIRCSREFCGTWPRFVVLSRDKCNGCHVSSRLLTSNPFKKINRLRSSLRPSFSPPPICNQGVAGSIPAAGTTFSQSNEKLAHRTVYAPRLATGTTSPDLPSTSQPKPLHERTPGLRSLQRRAPGPTTRRFALRGTESYWPPNTRIHS